VTGVNDADTGPCLVANTFEQMRTRLGIDPHRGYVPEGRLALSAKPICSRVSSVRNVSSRPVSPYIRPKKCRFSIALSSG
jgi:hypothetical protein